MHKLLFLLLLIASFGILNIVVEAQVKASLVTGEVTSVSDKKIVLQTKDGDVEVQLLAATEFKRVSPENPSLKTATESNLKDLSAGDRVIVTGLLSEDKKSIPAKAVYLMTKADISKRNESERESWKMRSITGRVVSLNPATKEITIAARGMMGAEQNIILSTEKADYRRYAPDSVKFDDAKTSSFEEVKVGDLVRVLGDKNAEGDRLKAERIVAGSFKTIGGMITTINPAENQITITDIQTKKPVTIALNTNTILKKFPAEFAQMMAMRMSGGGALPPQGANGQGNVTAGNMTVVRPPQKQDAPAQNGINGNGREPGMRTAGSGGAGARGEFDDLLERFPTISLTDLKVGDAIAISTTAADASVVTAIKLVSGIEPFLKSAQTTGNRRRSGQDSGFVIPGLDSGIGTP